MHRFLRKFFFFSLQLTLLLAFLTFLAHLLAQYNLRTFPVPNQVSNLFLGDSHIASGIDETIIEQAINVGSEGESYFISYYKIQMLRDLYPSIDTVFLGASYHNFSEHYEETTFGNASTRRYFFVLPLEAKWKLLCSMKNPPNYLVRSIFFQFKNYNQNRWTQGQRFEQKTGIRLEIVEKRIEALYFKGDTLSHFAASQVEYLQKIQAYCQEEQVELILLNMPLAFLISGSSTSKIYGFL